MGCVVKLLTYFFQLCFSVGYVSSWDGLPFKRCLHESLIASRTPHKINITIKLWIGDLQGKSQSYKYCGVSEILLLIQVSAEFML